MPGLLMLCFVAGFILLKIPTMTASLFSGHTGGHGIGMGGIIYCRSSQGTLTQTGGIIMTTTSLHRISHAQRKGIWNNMAIRS